MCSSALQLYKPKHWSSYVYIHIVYTAVSRISSTDMYSICIYPFYETRVWSCRLYGFFLLTGDATSAVLTVIRHAIVTSVDQC